MTLGSLSSQFIQIPNELVELTQPLPHDFDFYIHWTVLEHLDSITEDISSSFALDIYLVSDIVVGGISCVEIKEVTIMTLVKQIIQSNSLKYR